ncbi:MAG: hypothetical protein DBX55_02925 [Verrucomicrobia bacterium]|nr:MAG: hypothetical protein DBX55_02925 [Verrucomicrobiota bacterium]
MAGLRTKKIRRARAVGFEATRAVLQCWPLSFIRRASKFNFEKNETGLEKIYRAFSFRRRGIRNISFMRAQAKVLCGI